jgi:hypothetical protein
MRLRVVILLLVLASLLPAGAWAQSEPVPPLPDRNPIRPGAPQPVKPLLPGELPTVPWTEAEIATAKDACHTLLATITLDYEQLPPIKEGICGAPAPILLRSVGSDPKVVIDPPATVSCPLAKELDDWLKENVQPEAKALLGSQVVGLHNATSYACRNRYGAANTPLSEHALANALDVSEFVFASGGRITVLDAWPKLVPPPAPSPDATLAPGTKVKDGSASTTKPAAPKTGDTTPAKAQGRAAAKNDDVTPTKVTGTTPTKTAGVTAAKIGVITAAKAQPAPPSPASADPPPVTDPKSLFVKHVHDAACKDFGTVLGPEANAAHKNHFHLDMKARQHSNFCQ